MTTITQADAAGATAGDVVTQSVAVGGQDIVFETGLSNLTKDESTVLIHYGKERTDQMMLVRIEEPKDKK